jgi:hypothetical protein
MDYFGSSDLDSMLSGFGVPLEFVDANGSVQTAVGIVDIGDQDLYDVDAAQIAGKVMTVTIKTGAFVGIVEGSSLKVDGTTYSVIQTRQRDDGALSRIFLARIS